MKAGSVRRLFICWMFVRSYLWVLQLITKLVSLPSPSLSQVAVLIIHWQRGGEC